MVRAIFYGVLSHRFTIILQMTEIIETELTPHAPFDMTATVNFLRFTDAELVDTWRNNRYARALYINQHPGVLTVTMRDGVDAPTLGLRFIARKTDGIEVADVRAAAQRIFSTDHDLEGFRARIARDKLMRELESNHHGLRLARWATLFETLTISILSQQISTVVAMTLKRRLVEKFGARLEARGETFYAFPRSEKVAAANVEDLRALGLSGAKATSLLGLARAFEASELDAEALARAGNEEIIRRLVELRGVGRWTAEWALMLYFGRTDVFPAGDLALRGAVLKFYARHFKSDKPHEREIRAFAEKRWGAWASYSAIYILAGLRAGNITLRQPRVVSS